VYLDRALQTQTHLQPQTQLQLQPRPTSTPTQNPKPAHRSIPVGVTTWDQSPKLPVFVFWVGVKLPVFVFWGFPLSSRISCSLAQSPEAPILKPPHGSRNR
jgi:hypothetical protein